MFVPPSAKQNTFVADRKQNDILLIYPFAWDKEKIERAADGLNEAGANSMLEQESEADETSTTKEPPRSASPAPETSEDSSDNRQAIKARKRAHYLTVTVEEHGRLDPDEWLNDTLIDFWMQWLQRAVVDRHASDLHIFSSHFFTTLSDEGLDKVRSWTVKKNIDVFQKKLIFMPINMHLHWSLCVVINPAATVNASSDEGSSDDPLACMMLLDSLKGHNKVFLQSHVMEWLNAEWRRLEKEEDGTHTGDRFTKKTFPVLEPVIPYQSNGWDCGVFVCRHACSMCQLRGRHFTYAEAGVGRADMKAGKRPFGGLISDSSEFKFDGEDIVRIRQEIRKLIERLSMMHLFLKKEKNLFLKKEKKLNTLKHVRDPRAFTSNAKIDEAPINFLDDDDDDDDDDDSPKEQSCIPNHNHQQNPMEPLLPSNSPARHPNPDQNYQEKPVEPLTPHDEDNDDSHDDDGDGRDDGRDDEDEDDDEDDEDDDEDNEDDGRDGRDDDDDDDEDDDEDDEDEDSPKEQSCIANHNHQQNPMELLLPSNSPTRHPNPDQNYQEKPVEPLTPHDEDNDDSHDESSQLSPGHDYENDPVESLRPGDVIEHTSPVHVAGSRHGHRKSMVLNANPGEKFRIGLDNGEMLPPCTQIKRIEDGRFQIIQGLEDDELHALSGRFRPLSYFAIDRERQQLVGPENASSVAGLHRQALKISCVLKRGRQDIEEGIQDIFSSPEGAKILQGSSRN